MSRPCSTLLPKDIWIHCIAPFFCLRPASDDLSGVHLLRLFRMTPQQKAHAVAHMTHPAFEFRADIAKVASTAAVPSFATTLLEHAIRPCMRFVSEAALPPHRPLVIDTGPHRRIGRDHLLMSLVAALFRHAIKPVKVVVFGSGKRSCSAHLDLLMSMVHPDNIVKYHPHRLLLRNGCDIMFKPLNHDNGLQGVSADLILANDCQILTGGFLYEVLVPLLSTGASVVLMGQGEFMDAVVSALKLKQAGSPFDLAHALLPPSSEYWQ